MSILRLRVADRCLWIRPLAKYDVVLIATDHDIVDYKALVSAAKLVVDTRNACARAGAARIECNQSVISDLTATTVMDRPILHCALESRLSGTRGSMAPSDKT